MAQVTLNRVEKIYKGNVRAVKGIDLHIQDGQFVVLVGPPAAASPPPCA